MKFFVAAVLITCCLSSSSQELKINDMVSLLDKSTEQFNKEFWKSVSLFESFKKPMEVLDQELLKYGFEFNNFDAEEGRYDEVDLRYLKRSGTYNEFKFTVQADENNSFFYIFKDVAQWIKLKNEIENTGGKYLKTKSDTIRVPGMSNISLDTLYSFKDKTITLSESKYLMPGSVGKPGYYVWVRYTNLK